MRNEDFDIYREDIIRLLEPYTDAIYIDRRLTEKHDAVTMFSLHNRSTGKKRITMWEDIRVVELMAKYNRLFDLIAIPASMGPDIGDENIICMFDNGTSSKRVIKDARESPSALALG